MQATFVLFPFLFCVHLAFFKEEEGYLQKRRKTKKGRNFASSSSSGFVSISYPKTRGKKKKKGGRSKPQTPFSNPISV